MHKISACIITYNQEKYIAQCIESALMQQLSCDYEIVIGDDCSDDKTSEICQAYANKFPGLIHYQKRNVNLGMRGNWQETINNCSGDLIAICEGDDYWTDPLKLEKQIEFLDTTHGAVAVSTNATMDCVQNEKKYFFDLDDNFIHKIGICEIFENNVFPTLTGVYKAEVIKKINFQQGVDLPDWYLIINVMQYGDIYRLNFVSSHYRIHQNGIFSSTTDRQKLLAHIRTSIILMKQNRLKYKNVLVRKNNLRIKSLIRIDLKRRSVFDLIFDAFLLLKNSRV